VSEWVFYETESDRGRVRPGLYLVQLLGPLKIYTAMQCMHSVYRRTFALCLDMAIFGYINALSITQNVTMTAL